LKIQEKSMQRLQNKVAVVAGAATGIGAACVKRYVAEGAKVVIGDLNIATAQELAASLGGNAIAVRYDAADDASIKALIESAVAKFGRLDVLHNNVAVTSLALQAQDTTVVDIPLAIWNLTLNVNVTSFLLGSKYAIPHMLKTGGGSIINTSSDSGRAGDVTRTAYGASKAAIISLTQHIAVQYGLQGIRCNAITPGVILSRQMSAQPDLVRLIKPHILTPEFGAPEDIAALAAFLASDESGYITGQAIACDGGHLMHQPQIADVRKFEAEMQAKS
jgi:NAD(P)-dependent dehydrogenase (short-subunit alcohol dehydrogenase family)